MEHEYEHEMTRGDKIVNVIGVVTPFIGFIVAVVLLWNKAVDGIDLALFAFFYLASGFGVTIGFHRMLTHRSFQTSKPVEYLFAYLGSLSLQGPVIDWVADHRKHHAHTDKEGDPHSPHVGHGHGISGLVHAHMGWLFENQGQADWKRYARDLYEDKGMRMMSRYFPYIALASVLLPAVLGGVLHGSWEGVLRGAVWGGLVRIFLLHHVTWSINSVCHYFGARRFDVEDKSTNVALLAIPSLGEAWHHNHHAFPRSAEHGMKKWETAMDPSALAIKLMEKTGIIWDVVRIAPERQEQKLASRRSDDLVSAG
jgi:stearoyl-CoA desaturase (delta-9 desaturase)